jgi:hypothetical protein
VQRDRFAVGPAVGPVEDRGGAGLVADQDTRSRMDTNCHRGRVPWEPEAVVAAGLMSWYRQRRAWGSDSDGQSRHATGQDNSGSITRPRQLRPAAFQVGSGPNLSGRSGAGKTELERVLRVAETTASGVGTGWRQTCGTEEIGLNYTFKIDKTLVFAKTM